jgi:hypothetical protein
MLSSAHPETVGNSFFQHAGDNAWHAVFLLHTDGAEDLRGLRA